MEPKKFNIKESELFDNNDFLTESDGEDETQQEEQKRVSPEQIRIDSLKLALKIIKMFDKVTAEDLLNVSSLVSSYLINHLAGTEYDATDLDLSGDNSSDEETAEDNTEDLDQSDDINLDDMDDFTIEDSDEDNKSDESNNGSETEDKTDDEESDEKDEEDTNEGSGLLPDEFVI